MWRILIVLLGAFAASRNAAGVEVATGKMLGAGYDARSFYVRQGTGKWEKTYSGRRYRAEAAGRLMNLRLAQALFDDEWLTEFPFDAEKNTDRAIAALDSYKAHGILAISASLQAGFPGYNAEVPEIRRDRAYKLGAGKGAHISAFLPDGSLKPAWMKRLLRLQRALDRRGMILGLMYFYQGQDEVLRDTAAIDRAVATATDWLIDNNCRNVIIEIGNEHDIRGFDHDRYIHNEMAKLIELARSRFAAKKAAFRLPISASTGGSMRVYDSVRDHADLVIFHGNNRTPEQKRARTRELAQDAAMPGPVYMNEDDNGRDTTSAHLAAELASCDAVFQEGGSWGYMPWRQVQMFPFPHYLPAARAEVRDEMPPARRDAAYFKAVLEHVRKLILR